jgi:thiamine-monophosphate kinase
MLCTTGAQGDASGGLCAWQQGRLDSPFIEKLLEPEPRLTEGRALAQSGAVTAQSGAVTAMMDNSDGLALSLSDLAQVSHVGFVVQEEALPVASGLAEMVGKEKALEMVMSAGGDFELVFTVRPGGVEARGYEHRIAWCT